MCKEGKCCSSNDTHTTQIRDRIFKAPLLVGSATSTPLRPPPPALKKGTVDQYCEVCTQRKLISIVVLYWSDWRGLAAVSA